MGAIDDTANVRLRDRAIARSLPLMPRRLVRRVAAPYIAGETLEQALGVVTSLAGHSMSTTLDVLGEAISHPIEAEDTRDAYLRALTRLAELGRPDLVNVSVKLTALGLAIDPQLCLDNALAIARRAAELGGFVRIDMEDSPYTDATFDLYRELRGQGFDNIGVVVQAYLKRSAADVERLATEGARVRVVKGIYIEPDEIAWRNMGEINANFVRLSRTLAQAGCHVAFATHDDELVIETRKIVEELGLARDTYEYQMLLGVREPLRDTLVDQGHPMRVYVPYGAKWYEYSLRRLRENPRVAGHVASDVMGNVFGGKKKRARKLPPPLTPDAMSSLSLPAFPPALPSANAPTTPHPTRQPRERELVNIERSESHTSLLV